MAGERNAVGQALFIGQCSDSLPPNPELRLERLALSGPNLGTFRPN